MIKSISFKKDFRCFKAGDIFTFKPGTNVLVGDQGSGKSTLIELLRIALEPKTNFNGSDSTWRAKTIDVNVDPSDLISIDYDDNTAIMGIDFERESARDMSQLLYDNMDLQMYGMKVSHGQSNTAVLNKFLGKFVKRKDEIKTVLMDEPDSALSPRSCYNLLVIIFQLTKKFGAQTIVSVHNPIIINGIHPLIKDETWDEVLSLESKCWVTSKGFMIDQLFEREEKREKK